MKMVFNNIYDRNKNDIHIFNNVHDSTVNKLADLEIGSTSDELDKYIHAMQTSLLDRLRYRKNTRVEEPNVRFVSFLLAAECHELT